MAKVTKTTTTKKKRVKRNIPVGLCHVKSTFNNTVITITDLHGDVVAWGTAGVKGFKGSRKSTPFAAQMAAEDVAKRAMDLGMHTVSILINGPGSGRESAARAIAAAGMRVAMIKDITPIPHNGCRPPKRRRV